MPGRNDNREERNIGLTRTNDIVGSVLSAKPLGAGAAARCCRRRRAITTPTAMATSTSNSPTLAAGAATAVLEEEEAESLGTPAPTVVLVEGTAVELAFVDGTVDEDGRTVVVKVVEVVVGRVVVKGTVVAVVVVVVVGRVVVRGVVEKGGG